MKKSGEAKVLAVLVALALTGCGGAQLSPGAPERTLTRAEVREELQLIRDAMTEAYAGRVFRNGESWLRELDAVAERDHTVRSFCDSVGSALTHFGEPSVFITLESGGDGCRGDGGMAGGFPSPTADGGVNIAEGAERGFALMMQSDRAIAILGIRSFAAPGAPEWEGLDATFDELLGAEAIVIDLRNTVGDDPRALLPLVQRLAGLSEMHPLSEIVVREGPWPDRLRAGRRELYGEIPQRDPEVWRALVGEEHASRGVTERAPDPRDPDAPSITVLLGGACAAACEIVTRTLEAYAGATVTGTVGSAARLAVADGGVLALPHSRMRVSIPTAAYVLNPRIGAIGGIPGVWSRLGTGGSYDGLGAVLVPLRQDLAIRHQERRWVSADPPACEGYAPMAYEALPADARRRLTDSRLTPEPHEISGEIFLPPDRARAWLEACPQIRVGVVFASYARGRTSMFLIHTNDFAALTRLAQSEVIRYVNVETQPRFEPD